MTWNLRNKRKVRDQRGQATCSGSHRELDTQLVLQPRSSTEGFSFSYITRDLEEEENPPTPTCTRTHTLQCLVPMALRTPNPQLSFLKLPLLPQNCCSCLPKTGSYQSASDWKTAATFGLPIVFFSSTLPSLPFSRISRKSDLHSNTGLP